MHFGGRTATRLDPSRTPAPAQVPLYQRFDQRCTKRLDMMAAHGDPAQLATRRLYNHLSSESIGDLHSSRGIRLALIRANRWLGFHELRAFSGFHVVFVALGSTFQKEYTATQTRSFQWKHSRYPGMNPMTEPSPIHGDSAQPCLGLCPKQALNRLGDPVSV